MPKTRREWFLFGLGLLLAVALGVVVGAAAWHRLLSPLLLAIAG